MSGSYENELAVALEAVRAAAEVCQSVQASITPDVLEKKDRSPVTVADYASQAVVCRALAEAFPDDPVIGEEDSAALQQPDQAPFLNRVKEELGKVGIDGTPEEICGWIDRGGQSEYSNRFWTLDPIDGTKGFLRGEQYAIALALIVDGKPQLGVLGCPNLPTAEPWDGQPGCLFSAVAGEGAATWSMEDSDAAPVMVRVSETSDPASAVMCESVESGHSSHGHSAQLAEKLNISGQPVRLDSQAKYAVVARGEADMYLRLPTRKDYNEKIWDHAAGVLVVLEAGGTVTDLAGRELDFTHGRELRENRGVIVTNGPLHSAVLETLGAIGVA
ncbi:Histidinol-phosphatase [Maioricimonas rarisocia]|uniref:3'(2'),5'-bisphosphate nucleotidase n=1 Tax=Maioricimonas rarisocia TaxID=2528026 RepID=A0A517Z3R8_9PLAN|nr:3'(2'),5'-bisphosphate nucleotidase [Maioricimonas rarisocia]QDU37142.1 Histidinol-phosphatase [Maioricimonas rarisocia]